MLNGNYSRHSPVLDIILRYGLLRDEGLKQSLYELSASYGAPATFQRYAQKSHDIFVAIGGEYLRDKRPATSDITNLTDIPQSTARRCVSILEQFGLVRLTKDPKDGRRQFVELTSESKFIVDSFVNDCSVEFSDIVNLFDQKEREEAEKRYQTIFDNAAAGIGRSRSSDGLILLANDKLASLLGFRSPEELQGTYKFSDNYTDPALREQTLEHFRRNLGTTYEVPINRPDGSIVYLRMDVTLNEEEGHMDFVAVDVTENVVLEKNVRDNEAQILRLTTDKLEKSETRLHAFATVSPVGMFETDPHGNVTYLNERWCEIGDMTMEQGLGGGWSQALHPLEREETFKAWAECTKNGRNWYREQRYLRNDGSIIYCLAEAIAKTDKNGNITGYAGTVTDITRQKNLEKRLRKANTTF